MSLDHKFINGKHFFESFEHSQFLTIMVDAHCSCNAQTWTKGLICYHLQNCLQYLWMKPKDRLKVKFGNTSLERKNTVLGLVRSSNRKLNKIRTGENESPKHASLKEQVCNVLLLLKIDFVTEAIIEVVKIRQRADILVPELGLVIEVAVSESDESLEKKRIVFEKLGLSMKVVR